MRIRLLFLCCLVFVSSACTGTKFQQTSQVSQQASLAVQEKILIVLPADGRFSEKTYSGSGRYIASIFEKYLTVRSSQTRITDTAVREEQALEQAKALSYRYVFLPVIHTWEPRASSFSGRPGKASLTISVYDLSRSGQMLINKTLLTVQGKNYITETPEELMDELIVKYVEGLNWQVVQVQNF